MTKKPKVERTIKGEVEGYSREITPFPGKRGSRGMKVENEWHNMIGSVDFLELLEESFPCGSYVVFAERQNKKGYWDFIEGTLKKINKEEAYSEEIQDEIQTDSGLTPEQYEKLKGDPEFDHKHQQGKDKLQIQEETVRELTQADVDMLKAEVQTMKDKVLQKEH